MTKILYYDCFAGISGDMNLGALVDLGVDQGHLEKELGKLQIEGFHLDIGREMRKGISGTRVTVVVKNPENQKHRHLRHIEEIINRSTLSEPIKTRSLAIFELIADAEAKIHNISREKVHFHEVGALDSIADIVGAAICQEYLDVEEIRASPVQLGGGFAKCAHGMMPVPAPATAEILKGIPVRSGLVEYEATTPTGAAILAATVSRFTTELDFRIKRTGYGIGQRDGAIPNVLRVYLGEESPRKKRPSARLEAPLPDLSEENATMLECNIDDMNPEWFDHITSLLFEAGASEVFVVPVIMKKSRPGNILSVLCGKEREEALKEVILTQTSSIGLRQYPVTKSMLRREVIRVHTCYGEVDVKCSYYGGRRVREKPEYEQCRRLAMKHQVSLETIQKEIYKNL
ncbi:MAG: nickel pincer cofactor biosynthesis protein LarC [Bacteroidales bacterium]